MRPSRISVTASVRLRAARLIPHLNGFSGAYTDNPAATARCPGRYRAAPSSEHDRTTNGSDSLEYLHQLHVRRRNALQVIGAIAIGGVLNDVWMFRATRMPKKIGSTPNFSRSGRKIGTKMMTISVHSSGQPSRKMMTCARIRNWIRAHVQAEDELLDDMMAAEIGEHRREGPRADEKIADHRRGARRQIDRLLQRSKVSCR
jgi:hypothetical protein